MIKKHDCCCDSQQDNLNISSSINRKFLISKNKNQGNINCSIGRPGSSFPTDLVLDQLKDIANDLKENTDDISALKEKMEEHPSLNFETVTELPTTDISSSTIYLKKLDNFLTTDLYEEYVYINGEWELIGAKQTDAISLVDLELMLV